MYNIFIENIVFPMHFYFKFFYIESMHAAQVFLRHDMRLTKLHGNRGPP